jgi:hypothetical protein
MLLATASPAAATVRDVGTSAAVGLPPHAAIRTIGVIGGTLPRAVVGRPYSYRFRAADNGTALWLPDSGLPLGLSLDPQTGVLSGVPEVTGSQQVIVSAARGGASPALGSGSGFLVVGKAGSGADSVWTIGTRARSGNSGASTGAAAPAVPSATGSVTIPEKAVASALYQGMYFQAVNNPKAPAPDLVNVLLADVAAQVYASTPGASATTVSSELAMLRTALASATNNLAPASAGRGLTSFGPNLVPQLTGALGVLSAFAKSSGAGVAGPAAKTVATQVYRAYLKTSIATGLGYSTGYAGFSDRSLHDVGDIIGSGFHVLVSGPAIQRAVACGQAIAACGAVMDALLTPVVDAGLGSTASVSVRGTPAQLESADPTLATGLSKEHLSLAQSGTLTLPAGAFNADLTQAAQMELTLTQDETADLQALIAQAGDPASPADVSGAASADLDDVTPQVNMDVSIDVTLIAISVSADPKNGESSSKPLVTGDVVAQGVALLLKAMGSDDVKSNAEVGAAVGTVVDVVVGNFAGAIKDLFGFISGLGGGQDEAYTLAQQTDKMIQAVYTALAQDLSDIDQHIQNVQVTLDAMFKAMEAGFADIDFKDDQIPAGLSTVQYQLGQLQYQADLTDGDLVAFGQGVIQSTIQGTINRCLDLAARQLAPLNFTAYSTCASDFKTEALTDATNDAVEFTTPPPPAPTAANQYATDATVATTLAAHDMDPDAELSYLLGILNNWYGLGTDPATASPGLVNPGVWSEVALAYRELLDEYPQYSAGPEPDLAAIEAPGQQIAQLIGALQTESTATWTDPAIAAIFGNYQQVLNQLYNDIVARQDAFPAGATPAQYGTPGGGQPWANYNAFAGPEQSTPAGAAKQPAISSVPYCSGGDPISVPDSPTWETGINLPNSWYLLQNLVGYANPALAPTTAPVCYTFSQSDSKKSCITIKGNPVCTWVRTEFGSITIRFEGTDGALHTVATVQLETDRSDCSTAIGAQYCGVPSDTYFSTDFAAAGSLQALLVNHGGRQVTPDATLLDSEGSQILAAEQKEVYQWDLDGLGGADTAITADSSDLLGAFQLIQLAAQVLAPQASLGNQAIADILYGQDQLATTVSGPNGPMPVLTALQAGTGTTSLGGWAATQGARLGEAENLLNGYLGSAQQASGMPARTRLVGASAMPPAPPKGDLPTAEAPTLVYSVLAQLGTGAALDTDSVAVKSPGTQTAVVGKTVSLQLSASSSAGAKITTWKATGLPPGLSISPGTGKVTGRPAKAGSYTATVTATDTVGSSVHNSGSVPFTWKVLPPP